MNRSTYYNLIHHGIESMLTDRFGHFSEPQFPEYLSALSGKESCLAMSDEELMSAVDNLRCEGYLEDIKSSIPD
ncbi:hypothetical protein [Vibrio rhodolitus]|uniref:hypothetical protein n=1 Tax=Vibrio rhodolitus TaxID=2231649 RepID=UPI001FC9C523|nr:hypothetical protein [Vibrio rhodolitus]